MGSDAGEGDARRAARAAAASRALGRDDVGASGDPPGSGGARVSGSSVPRALSSPNAPRRPVAVARRAPLLEPSDRRVGLRAATQPADVSHALQIGRGWLLHSTAPVVGLATDSLAHGCETRWAERGAVADGVRADNPGEKQLSRCKREAQRGPVAVAGSQIIPAIGEARSGCRAAPGSLRQRNCATTAVRHPCDDAPRPLALCRAAKKPEPASKRLVIISGPRTGSSLLIQMLRAHDQVLMHGEPFHEFDVRGSKKDGFDGGVVIEDAVYEERHSDPQKLLDAITATATKELVGFKLFRKHVPSHKLGDVMQWATHVIWLTREDRLAQYVSICLALKSGSWCSSRTPMIRKGIVGPWGGSEHAVKWLRRPLVRVF